ncbi:MAG: hypothetical protein V3W20_10480 [Candidatus Neomarinimicrobiota bacterium]
MAGGLFGRPFTFNVKCIIFSMICMALFLYKPNIRNQYVLYGVLFIIFTVAYVAMAWYDYYFNCDLLPLQKGGYSLQQYIKPPPHKPKKQIDHKEEEVDRRMRRMLIYASHILFIVPMLAYLALYKTKVNPIIYPLLGVLAVFTLGYHGLGLMTAVH